ncbi:MAG: aminodeoxychorismate synthase component I [Spongiibacteraceae bacterium]
MDQLIIEEQSYYLDSTPIFAQFLDMQQAVYLDSAAPFSTRGRYDIISAEPLTTLQIFSNSALNTGNYKDGIAYLNAVKQAVKELTPSLNNSYQLPFIGGALGYLGYDFGRQLEQLPSIAADDLPMPQASMGIYSWAIIIDHQMQRSLLVAHPQTSKDLLNNVRYRLRNADQTIAKTANDSDRDNTPFKLRSAFEPTISRNQYNAAFSKIQNYLHAGDCYQVNLTQRFSAHCEGDPWQAYLTLRETAAAPYSGYLQLEQGRILSLSPERLLQINQNTVSSSPIKGTIARGQDAASDRQLAQQLTNSAKDRAENLMIVDLIRNDLGKSCIAGSIHVDQLFELQSFETVHHLVSTISGQLRDNTDAFDVLADCFPGGSITGAPKKRAMEIIEELEPQRRSVYCGSLVYISSDGQMDSNIAIRTMIHENNRIHCSAGGGIVTDSLCDSEYQECLTKVGPLLAALDSNGSTEVVESAEKLR